MERRFLFTSLALVLLLAGFSFVAAGCGEKKTDPPKKPAKGSSTSVEMKTMYVCESHPTLRAEAGECAECGGMKLTSVQVPKTTNVGDTWKKPDADGHTGDAHGH